MVVVGQKELTAGYFSAVSNRAKHYWQRFRGFVVPKPKITLTLNAPIKVTDEIRAHTKDPIFFGRNKKNLVKETRSEYDISNDPRLEGKKLTNIKIPKGYRFNTYSDHLGRNDYYLEHISFVKDHWNYSDWINVTRYPDGKVKATVRTNRLLSPGEAKKLGYVEE